MTFKEKLEREREEITDKINNPIKYSRIHFFKRLAVNYKLFMIDIAPCIVAVVLTMPLAKSIKQTPFMIDEIEESEKIEVIDSSNGMHIERLADKSSAQVTLKHSTGWVINEYGLYERTQTTYILNNIDINDHEFIFSMSKEELESSLVPIEREIITKQELSDEDQIYGEEVITICNLKETGEIIREDESKVRNIISTITYILLNTALGTAIKAGSKIVFHDRLKDKLTEEKKDYLPIDENEIQRLSIKLQWVESNLELFQRGKVI